MQLVEQIHSVVMQEVREDHQDGMAVLVMVVLAELQL
jgi:hypothetical protein